MVNDEDEVPNPDFLERKSIDFVSISFIALSFLNTLLLVTTTLGNTLIVFALRKKSSIYPPSRFFLRSLAITDLCVGLISQLLAALHAIAILTGQLAIYLFTSVSSYVTSAVLSGVSLFILTFISIDRLLALSLGVQYRQTVTTGRVRAFVLVSWSCASFAEQICFLYRVYHSNRSLRVNVHLLLRQNLPYPSSATNKSSSYRLSSKTHWKVFAHHRTLQKISFKRTVGLHCYRAIYRTA